MRIRLLSVMLACLSVVATSASAQSLGESLSETIREATRDALLWAIPGSYQGGDKQKEKETKDRSARTEQFSRKVKIARDGRLTVSNTAGDIIVTTGSGDEVSIDATKRARAGANLADVEIEVTDRAGRIDVRTDTTVLSGFRGNGVSVDFT